MKWALLLLMLSSSLASAAKEEPRPSCGPWYARLAGAAKAKVVDTAKSAKDGVINYKNAIKEEGPLRVIVRKRTPEELALGYREYFLRPDQPWQGNGITVRALNRLRRLNPARNFNPASGAIKALDRLFLRSYTVTNPFRVPVELGAGLAASIALTEALYEKPMSYLETTIPFERAVREGLDSEYAFRYLRDKISKKEITRAEAEKLVAEEYRARAKYFDLVRLVIETKQASSMDEVAPDFLPLLGEKELGASLKDLRVFLGDGFRKNPAFIHPAEAKPITPDQYKELFSLNHTKLYASASLPDWLDPRFKRESLAEGSAAREIYDEVMSDPFRAKLISYQKKHKAKIPLTTLAAWLSEDIEWSTRIASLEVLGSGVKATAESSKPLTLGDRRAAFLAGKKIDFAK